MFKSKQPPIKGIIFAGCSFTWGQGLYYYGNLSTLKEPDLFLYEQNYVRFSHYQYLQSVRFPRLVANFFNKFEICQPFNGGDTEKITNWWRTCFKEGTPDRHKSLNHDRSSPSYDYCDFSHLIFQTTQWTRSSSFASYEIKEKLSDSSHIAFMQSKYFKPWLTEHNLTIDEYIHKGITKEIIKIKNFLQLFIANGIKTYILCWPNDMAIYLKQDSFFANKMITFNYKSKHYDSLEDMMGNSQDPTTILENPELTIHSDYDNFELTPKDGHPSLLCHKVIANCIINTIRNDF